MKWIFEGQPIENLAKGIYLSIGNRIAKMRIDPTVPLIIIGGVITYHSYLKTLMEEKLTVKVLLPPNAQHIVSLGAALMAKEYYPSATFSTKHVTNEELNSKS
jgi:activator of 2-hydroxyglutaryl-CoA dehydratase